MTVSSDNGMGNQYRQVNLDRAADQRLRTISVLDARDTAIARDPFFDLCQPAEPSNMHTRRYRSKMQPNQRQEQEHQ